MTIEIPLSKTGKYAGKYVAIVDDCDRDLAQFNWNIHLHRKGRNSYAQRGGRQPELLHRIILARVLGRPLVKGEVVDHINGNGLDNRRDNLRLATPSQNQWNSKKHIDNTSGYKGVRLSKSTMRWEAKITFQGKFYYLGLFATPEEAYTAYCVKAQELFGKFAKIE